MAAAKGERTGEDADAARRLHAWLDASPPPLPSARATSREWEAVRSAAVYPQTFESRAKACPSMSMAEAVQMGSERLIKQGPTKLTNASSDWLLTQWSDASLAAEVEASATRVALAHASSLEMGGACDALLAEVSTRAGSNPGMSFSLRGLAP